MKDLVFKRYIWDFLRKLFRSNDVQEGFLKSCILWVRIGLDFLWSPYAYY